MQFNSPSIPSPKVLYSLSLICVSGGYEGACQWQKSWEFPALLPCPHREGADKEPLAPLCLGSALHTGGGSISSGGVQTPAKAETPLRPRRPSHCDGKIQKMGLQAHSTLAGWCEQQGQTSLFCQVSHSFDTQGDLRIQTLIQPHRPGHMLIGSRTGTPGI